MTWWGRSEAQTRTGALSLLLALVSVGAFMVVHDGAPSGPLRWWALAPMFVAAELLAVHFEFRREAHSFTLSEIPVVLGLLLASPTELIAARLLAAVAVLAVRSGQRGLKLAFNLALVSAETGVAIVVFALLASGRSSGPMVWFAAAGASSVAALLSAACVHRVIKWHGAESNGIAFAAIAIYGALANASIAIIAWRLAVGERLALVLLGVIGSLVFVTSRAYAALTQRYGGLGMLYGFTRTLSSVSSEGEMIDVALAEAAALLRAEVGVIVRHSKDGSVEVFRKREGEPLETGVLASGAELFDLLRDVSAPIVVGAGDSSETGRALLRVLEVDDAVVVPQRLGDDLVGVMAVGNRLGQVSTFDEEDGRLFETLVNHLSVAVRNGELVDELRGEVATRVHQALHDGLTDLPNRTLFHQLLNAHIAERPSHVAVLLMDLDRFKEVNDTLGHHSGDAVLCEVSVRLLAALPPSAVVARLGGDEFAVFLRATDGEQALDAVTALQASLRLPLLVDGLALDIGASIGVAMYPTDGHDATVLLQRADVAMYAAKRSPDGVEVYRDELDSYNPRRLTLAGELRIAVETGAIDVYFQPKARMTDGQIVGVEALARWNHPDEGFISPDEFIAIAEQTGLIRPLTTHVLSRALEQCNAFAAAGYPIGVAVNLSSRSLVDSGLPDLVAGLLAEYDVMPSRLTLEITETNVMADVDRCMAVLDRLDQLGVDLSVDDFGTGYSSLSYLQRLPVDEVKIDMSFVRTMRTNRADAALVRSIITMGQNLGLRVVAEGVEDTETWNDLRDAGCDIGQGYVLARPQPGAEILALLECTQIPEHVDRGALVAAVAPT